MLHHRIVERFGRTFGKGDRVGLHQRPLPPRARNRRHRRIAYRGCPLPQRGEDRISAKQEDAPVPGETSAFDIGLRGLPVGLFDETDRSEEHTSELQSLMRNSYAVFCLKKKTKTKCKTDHRTQ